MSGEESTERDSRAARLAVAGVVGASVAHELRNVLAVAESSLYLARREIDNRARLLGHLDQIGVELGKAHAVIGSVLSLARGEPPYRESTQLAPILDITRHALPFSPHVTFEISVDPADLVVFCDPILLERVLTNLMQNALDAMGGRPGRIAARARAEAGGVRVEVEDDGPGIAPEVGSRLFEPLVTGKAKGTGLGLSLSRTIMEAHGGSIVLGRGAMGGAMFSLWLPGAAG